MAKQATVSTNLPEVSKTLRVDPDSKYKLSYAIVPGRVPIIPEVVLASTSRAQHPVKSGGMTLWLHPLRDEYKEYFRHLNEVILFANLNNTHTIITTGGVTNKLYPTISEGASTRDYLLGKFSEAELKPQYTLNGNTIVVVEDKSTLTLDNIRGAIQIINETNNKQGIQFAESHITLFSRPALLAKSMEDVMTHVLGMNDGEQLNWLKAEYGVRMKALGDTSSWSHLQKKLGANFIRLAEGVQISNVTVMPFRVTDLERISLEHNEAIADPIAQMVTRLSGLVDSHRSVQQAARDGYGIASQADEKDVRK